MARKKDPLYREAKKILLNHIELDEDGHPFSTAQDHGVGTRSVLAFVNQTGSEIRYVAEDKVFKVRMIIG